MATDAHRTRVHEAIDCLRRLSDAFQRRRQDLADSVGITEQQWSVLEEISTEHFMPSMFARQRESSAAAVSKTIRQLVDKGLVSVSLSKEDGRQREYVLTAKGKRVMGTLRDRREEAIRAIWLELPREDVEHFVRFAGNLTERLENQSSRRMED
jgi:DNA-binding MarR family transcriptional regulator